MSVFRAPSFNWQTSAGCLREWQVHAITGTCHPWNIQSEMFVTCQTPWLEMSISHWQQTVRAVWVFPDHSVWHLFTPNWAHNGANNPIWARTRSKGRPSIMHGIQLSCYSLQREIALCTISTFPAEGHCLLKRGSLSTGQACIAEFLCCS